MPEFTLLPHAHRREIMNQVVISLHLVTGLLLSVSTAAVPHLHTTCWSSPCLQKQLFWGQKFRDSRPGTSITYCKDQAGKLGQPGCGLGPAKQLLLTTFLKARCLGVTRVVQKFLTLQPDPMLLFLMKAPQPAWKYVPYLSWLPLSSRGKVRFPMKTKPGKLEEHRT